MMSKLFILAILLIAAATVTGVLDVSFHPERVASAPGALLGMARSGDLFERGRALAVSTKRMFELYSAQEEDQKMEVMLGFIRQDAERLESLINTSPQPQKLVPQAKLLAKSVEQAKEQSEAVSEGTLAELKGVSEEAFGKAGEAMNKLAQLQQQLAEGSQQLEDAVADIDIVPTEDGEVAGSSDEPEPSDPPQSSIPLRF